MLITGCSTGIGRATAGRLAAKGHVVYASARRLDSVTDLTQSGCRIVALDVTDEDSMLAAVRHVESEQGAVDVLVNNAGYSQSGAVEEVGMDAVRRQFETNVFGLMRLCQLVLPGMRGQGSGRIINVSSMGGRLTFPGGGVYHATKHAVEALSDALRFEVQGFGVDVVIIEPGLIRTQFARTAVDAIDAGVPGDGPYARFNVAVAAATSSAYVHGPVARLGGGPQTVARAIERAIMARRPKTRYRVTPSAHAILGVRSLMTDRMWDRMLAGQYPRPGRE